MTFDAPTLLLLAPAIALAIGVLAWIARARRIRLAGAWSAALGARAARGGRWLPVTLALAAGLAALSLAGPRFGRADVTATSQGLSLVLAMDISRSMLAEDVSPSRLGRAAEEARRLILDLGGDRVGLIAFAGRSYILSPLTIDGGAVSMYLDALDPELASEGGTNISAVLRQGRELLETAEPGADRVLVIFTDAEGHDSLGEALTEAKALKASGVRTILVAEGGPTPVTIPVHDSAGSVVGFQQDNGGETVRTSRQDKWLTALAEATGGSVISADAGDQAGSVRDLVGTFSRKRIRETRSADLVPRGWIGILAGAVVLLLATLVRRRGALVALAGLALLGNSPASAQRPSRGVRDLEAGDPTRAAQAFLKQAAGGGGDTAMYNAGTALLEAGRFDLARKALVEASRSTDPELRYRALYNLGLSGLLEARRDSARRDTLLAESADRFREALRIDPASQRAKWNLELAERMKPPPSGGGGGQSPPSGGKQDQKKSEPDRSDLDRARAEEILGSMERQERETLAGQQRRIKRAAPAEKDW